MADSGVIFGDPTTGVGFGDPDVNPQLGLGIPLGQIQVPGLLCPAKIACPGSDNPITNYTAENIPPFATPRLKGFVKDGYCCDGSYVSFTSFISEDDAIDGLNRLLEQCDLCPPPSGSLYSCSAQCANGGGTVLGTSNLSQADACARAQVLAAASVCPPVPPVTEFCNAQQSCSVPCPDGTSFTFIIPACTVIRASQQEADFIAFNLACTRAQKYKFCLGDLPRCTCVGSAYSGVLKPSIGGLAPISFTLLGSLPLGLIFTNDDPDTHSATISGTPTTAGTYSFSIEGVDFQGNTIIKQFAIVVLQITTTTLPDYTIGAPYSAQLTATGGSGNYAWKIAAGNLPDGLSLSLTGLISGTPTAANGTPLTFQVIDQNCEALDRSFFTPRAALSGKSHTAIQTKHGYGEFVSVTGNLYKKITWAGSIGQAARTIPVFSNGFADLPLGGAYWLYSGSSEIDIFGNFISHHQKNRFSPCNGKSLLVSINFLPQWSTPIFYGYCFNGDPLVPVACQPCQQDPASWGFVQNDASDSQFDFPPMVMGNVQFTQLTVSGTAFALLALLKNPGGPDPNFPPADINGIAGPWARLGTVNNIPQGFTGTLSDPYTDADAIASQITYSSNGLTAENNPSYKTFNYNHLAHIQSQFTTVNFTIHCTNLVVGESYDVKYEYWDSDSTRVVIIVTFVADATTHDLAGTVPTPDAGHTKTIKNVVITFT